MIGDEFLKFQEGSSNDKQEIQKLFKICFKNREISEKNPELWEWQNNQNPEGKSIIGLAYVKDILVGHYCILPFQYENDNHDIITVGLAIDAMIHPNFRKRGIFILLSKFILQKAIEKLNIDYTIGFNFTGTALSSVLPGHLKVGWQIGQRLYLYFFPINLTECIKYRFPNLIIDIYQIIELFISPFFNRVYESFRQIWKKKFLLENQILKIDANIEINDKDIVFFKKYPKPFFTKKITHEYLEWRYLKHPENQYIIFRLMDKSMELKGIVICRKIKTKNNTLFGIIIDKFGENDILSKILFHIIQYFKSIKYSGVFLLDNKDSDLAKYRTRLLFLSTHEYYQFIFRIAKRNVKTNLFQANLNFGDFDVF